MRRFFVGLAITAMLGIIPCQARGNDRQISQAIVKNLQAEQKNGKLKGFDIDLEVEEGTVYLKGTVSNEEQEKLALDIARRVDGVRQVYNEISIRTPGDADETIEVDEAVTPIRRVSNPIRQESTDAEESTSKVSKRNSARASKSEGGESKTTSEASREVAARIIERLKQEKAAGTLKGFSLDVEVDEGVAWLSGKVATPEQQNMILEIVRNVPGVKQVVNGLSVARTTASPSEIAQQVIAKIQEQKSSGALRDFSVDVEVDQGIVWLSGSAKNEQQQQLILDAARYVPGVSKVVNDITIPGRTPGQQAATKKAHSGPKSAAYAQQAVAQSSATEPASPRPPQPLPLEDGPIGSAVAAPATLPVANPQATMAGRPGVQYMWVPATQMAQTAVAPATGSQTPLAFAPARAANYNGTGVGMGAGPGVGDGTVLSDGVSMGALNGGQPVPMNAGVPGVGIAPARFDHPQMPQYAWPSYAPYPNYGAVTYPKQYSPMAWPYIGPFYPYPQVPLGWRKVELKWKDGWWQLDFKDRYNH